MDLTTEARKVKGLAESRAEACSKLTRKKGSFLKERERERERQTRDGWDSVHFLCKDDA